MARKIDRKDHKEARGFVPLALYKRFREYAFDRGLNQCLAMEEVLNSFFCALDHGLIYAGSPEVLSHRTQLTIRELVQLHLVQCKEMFQDVVDPQRVDAIAKGEKPTLIELELLAACLGIDIVDLVERWKKEYKRCRI